MERIVRIGLLINHSHAFYRNILQGVRAYADLHPEWIFMPIREENGRMRWYGTEHPDGIIASIHTPQLARMVRGWHAPLVNVSSVLHDLPWPRVVPDSEKISRMAAQHLLERGLRNFGFVGHSEHLYSVEREAAFRKVLNESGFDVSCYHARRDHSFQPHAELRSLDHRAEDWLLKLPKPTGIMVPTDFWGVELTEVCRHIGVRVPEDIAVVGAGNDDLYTAFSRPPLSSVVLPTKQIGHEAAAMLDRLISGARPPAKPLLIAPTHVNVRRSTDVLNTDDPVVIEAVRFIREHAHLPLSVADVLRDIHLSRRPLERRFRECLGHGVADDIRRSHIERSRQLLIDSDLSMEAVAQQSGFSGARHMATVYRREIGMAPSDYRGKSRLN